MRAFNGRCCGLRFAGDRLGFDTHMRSHHKGARPDSELRTLPLSGWGAGHVKKRPTPLTDAERLLLGATVSTSKGYSPDALEGESEVTGQVWSLGPRPKTVWIVAPVDGLNMIFGARVEDLKMIERISR